MLLKTNLAASTAAAGTSTALVFSEFSGVSWESFIIVLIVCAFSALTKYFVDVANQTEPYFNLIDIISYGLSGILAGALIFLLTSYFDLHHNVVLIATSYAGYSGKYVLSVGPLKWFQDFMDKGKSDGST